MQTEHVQYQRLHSKSQLEKSLNSLLGLIEGIAIDGDINQSELALVRLWLEDHQHFGNQHPYNEIIPVLSEAMGDGVLDSEERADPQYLCERLTSAEYFSKITADLQRLHAVVGGIAADGAVSVEEMRALSDWLANHDHLKTCWPYDEIEALTTKVLQDGRVDDTEQRILLSFFTEFLAVLDERTIVSPLVMEGDEPTIGGFALLGQRFSLKVRRFVSPVHPLSSSVLSLKV